MGKADEAAEHAVAIEAVGEISVPRTPDAVALVPIGARIGVEHQPQPLAIKLGIGARRGLAEELPEFRIAREGTQPRELELEKRQMSLIEIDGVDLRRLRGEIGQRVASTGGNGDDGRSDRQPQRCEVSFGILPDLGVHQTTKPECEKLVPNGRLCLASRVADRVRDKLGIHSSLESAIRQRYRPLAAVLRQQAKAKNL